MIRTVLVLVAALALPSLLMAQTPQIPNEHASDRGKAMVALHSQGAVHRATHRRGDVVTPPAVPGVRNPNAATPAVPATAAIPGHGAGPTIPAKPATPAVPAHKGGQSGNHRP
jgi:hypothetical protein